MIFLYGDGELPHKVANKEGGIFLYKKAIKIFSKRGTSTPVRMRGSRVTSHETSPGKRKAVQAVTGGRSRQTQYERSDGSG